MPTPHDAPLFRLNKIKNLTLSFNNIILLTGLEFICLYFLINNLFFHKLHYNNHIIYIIDFIIIIILFLINKGMISKILNLNIWVFLSKYTYSLYMTHIIMLNTLRGSFWKTHSEWIYAHPVQNVIYTLIGVFILGVFTYHFVEKPSTAYLKKKFIK